VVAGSAAGAAGAGALLHPPRSSNPVNPIDSIPAREQAFCLCAWPPEECPGLKNACFFMILSLNKIFCTAMLEHSYFYPVVEDSVGRFLFKESRYRWSRYQMEANML
jgi:hypothetical protein